jgi:hypothetical protein
MHQVALYANIYSTYPRARKSGWSIYLALKKAPTDCL